MFLFIQDGTTALRQAAISQFEGMEKTKFLLEHGAIINIPNKVTANFSTVSVGSERKKRKHDRL